MKNTELEQIEEDLIEFLAKKNNEPRDRVLMSYLSIKQSINLASKEYRHLVGQIYTLYGPYLNDYTEASAIIAYQHFSFLHVLRFIAYSFPKRSPTLLTYLRAFLYYIRKREITKIRDFLLRSVSSKEKTSVDNFVYGPVTIVDYGCGLAYESFEIAKNHPGTYVVLVDIDAVSLDFTEYRFSKYRIPHTIIRVTPDNIYPKLPAHDLCIANEIMEHLHRPLIVYENIYSQMREGGILYGDFGDHKKEPFHVSSDLSDLRERIHIDYHKLTPNIYKKLSRSS